MDYDMIQIGDYLECQTINKKNDRNLDGRIFRDIVAEKCESHRFVKHESGWCQHEKDKTIRHLKSSDFNIFKDGDQWCATPKNFVDLQISPAGFGETKGAAIRDLLEKDKALAALSLIFDN